MAVDSEDFSFLYCVLTPIDHTSLSNLPHDLKLCEACMKPGSIVGVRAEQKQGLSEKSGDRCGILQCNTKDCHNSGKRWACCLTCSEIGILRVKRMLKLSQWKKHIQNVHLGREQKSKNRSKRSRPLVHIPNKKANTTQCQIPIENSPRPSEDIDNFFPIQDEEDDNHEAEHETSDAEKTEATLFGQRHDALASAMVLWSLCNKRGDNLGFKQDSTSARFFQQDFITESANGGIEYLVKQTQMLATLEATSFQNEGFNLPPGHALIQMRIAQHVYGMSPSEKELAILVMMGSAKIGIENGYAEATSTIAKAFSHWVKANKMDETFSDDFIGALAPKIIIQEGSSFARNAFDWSTRLPSSVNDLRRVYLEGAHSIVQNLPYPPIMTDVPGHSYVSVIDCVRDFLAYKDNHMATIPNALINSTFRAVRHPSESKRAQAILQQLNNPNYLKGYLFFWSDDMEPNQLNKAGRGSVWVATVTIGTQKGDGHNFANTYLLALGEKKENHDMVIEKVEEDMKKLRIGEFDCFYAGAIKKRGKVLMAEMAHLADQPERRGFNYLRGGNGAFSARFGASADHLHKDCYQEIRACPSCRARTRCQLDEEQYMLPLPTCDKCMNWDVLKPGSLLGLANPPENYPLREVEEDTSPNFYGDSPYCRIVIKDGKQKIRPFRITYESLKGAVELAHECYCDHGWSAKNLYAYLKVEGLNDDFIGRVAEYATRCYALKIAQATEDDADCPSYYKNILQDAKQNPEQYRRVPFPPPWNRVGFGLKQNPDVIMHLIFLGLVKDAIQTTQGWLKATRRNSLFIKQSASVLDPLVKMDIQWVNVLRYSGEKFGHWVSENHLGFARVMPWFYQNIASLKPEHVALPPESQQKAWNKSQNEHWLLLRGLDASGNAAELKHRVAGYLSEANPPKPVEIRIHSVELVEDLILVLQVLLECVMTTTVTANTVARAELAVRAYLSAYDLVKESIDTKSCSIFSTFNLACLMNLPEAMDTYGPLRQLWEGATRGEGFLRFVKPLINQGLRHSNWHYHLLQKAGITKAFGNILRGTKPNSIPANATVSGLLKDRKGNFHKYKTVYNFKKNFEAEVASDKTPISVVLILRKTGDVQIMAVVDSYDTLIRISTDSSVSSIKKFGLHYYKFVASETLLQWSDIEMDVVEIGYGLLLPFLETTSDVTHNATTNDTTYELYKKFALVSSNWKKLGPTTPLEALVEVGSASFD